MERPEPLVAALYRLTDDPGTEFADLTRLTDRLPLTTHLNRRLLAADPAAPTLPDLVMNLTNRAVILSGAGRRDEAAEARAQAVDIQRRLARTNPEGAAVHLAQLAMGLGAFGEQLAEAGRPDEAVDAMLEAVAVTRELQADDPGARLSQLALRLVGLVECLLMAGRRREVPPVLEELITLQEGPLREDPWQRPILAHALAVLGMLQHAGGQADARSTLRRAVEVAQDAVRADSAHEHALVSALYAQGMELAENGQRDQGLSALAEAVDTARRLADGDTTREPALAQALYSLGEYLAADEARHDQALEATAEAVTLRRPLADADPAAHEADLGAALANHGLRLAEAGRFDEALSATEEAVFLSRRRADVHLAAHEPYLGYALYAYAKVRLLANTELPQARKDIAQALTIYRGLGLHEPGLVAYHLPDMEWTRARLGGG